MTAVKGSRSATAQVNAMDAGSDDASASSRASQMLKRGQALISARIPTCRLICGPAVTFAKSGKVGHQPVEIHHRREPGLRRLALFHPEYKITNELRIRSVTAAVHSAAPPSTAAAEPSP